MSRDAGDPPPVRARAWTRARLAWRRAVRGWPIKLGAAVVAILLWWVAATDPGQTTQRSVLVPLEVQGLAADVVAVGLPARVEVVVAGPSGRMDRLRADDLDVVLDLSDANGEFARRLEARAPTAVRVERVVPAEVIGRLEAVRSRRFAVVPYVRPDADARPVVSTTLEPDEVTVHARDPVLARVASVIAPVPAATDGPVEVALVPVDEAGRAVEEARVAPARATVTVVHGAPTFEANVPVEAFATDVPWTIEALEPAAVRLSGPRATLEELESVAGVVAVPTEALRPGRYDLPVRLMLPDGVTAREPVFATVVVPEPDPPGASP